MTENMKKSNIIVGEDSEDENGDNLAYETYSLM